MSAPYDWTPCGDERELVERDGPTAEPTPDYTGEEGKPPRPTDEDVRALMANVRKARAIFTAVYGLSGWTIDWCYHREPFSDPNRDAAMYVVLDQWMYMRVQVHVSIDFCYDDDYERVRYKVAHELAHCLVEPLVEHTVGTKDKHVRNAEERLVHQIAAAAIDAYERGAADAQETKEAAA